MTAPRSYPAHAGFHWAITESYHREQQTRIAAFKVELFMINNQNVRYV